MAVITTIRCDQCSSSKPLDEAGDWLAAIENGNVLTIEIRGSKTPKKYTHLCSSQCLSRWVEVRISKARDAERVFQGLAKASSRSIRSHAS